MKKTDYSDLDFRNLKIDSSKGSIQVYLPVYESSFNKFCKENKQAIDTYNFWKEKLEELKYRLDYSYKLTVVKNRDAKGSILARVKWQYKYKGEYRKPAYIGVYIGSLNDFPKGLKESNINEVAKSKIDEYFATKIPLIFQDVNGNEYQL